MSWCVCESWGCLCDVCICVICVYDTSWKTRCCVTRAGLEYIEDKFAMRKSTSLLCIYFPHLWKVGTSACAQRLFKLPSNWKRCLFSGAERCKGFQTGLNAVGLPFRDGERELREVPQPAGGLHHAAGMGGLPRRAGHQEWASTQTCTRTPASTPTVRWASSCSLVVCLSDLQTTPQGSSPFTQCTRATS